MSKIKKEQIFEDYIGLEEFIKNCDVCGSEVSFISNRYNISSEYEVDSFVKCKCENYIEFVICVG